jgi:hypothetical protein
MLDGTVTLAARASLTDAIRQLFVQDAEGRGVVSPVVSPGKHGRAAERLGRRIRLGIAP